MFGLKVNFHKICVGGLGVDGNILSTFAGILNCRMMSIPFVFLGMPIGENPR